MRLYVDNDVLIKLACTDLLDDLLAAFSMQLGDVWILPSAQHYFKRGRSINKLFDEATILRAVQFAASASLIDDGVSQISHIDKTEAAVLSTIPDIDSGEAILFAATHDQDDFLLTSGDKRSLMALANASSCRQIAKRLSGKVLCFEQVILHLIDQLGIERIARAVVAANFCCDKTLKIVFSDQQRTLEGLKSYVEDLRKQTGYLLKR